MVGGIGDWHIPPENRYIVGYSYRGGEKKFKLLDSKLQSFNGHDFVGKITKSSLGHMYEAMKHFHFGCSLPYHMLSRSVYTDKREFLIRLGDTTCRLGKMEFALISGLSFKAEEQNTRAVLEKEQSSLIAKKDPNTGVIDTSKAPFLQELKKITVKDIENELTRATDPELAFKIGLIYLIEAVMYGKRTTTAVSPFVFKLVEDTNRFLSYPWGTYFWDLSIGEWNDKINFMKKPLIGKNPKRIDICSLVPVLFVWAYETLLGEGNLSGEDNDLHVERNTTHTTQVPRILRWRQIEGCMHENKLSDLLHKPGLRVNRYLQPNEGEVRFLRDNGLTDDEINNPPPIYPAPTLSPAMITHVVPPPPYGRVAPLTQCTHEPVDVTGYIDYDVDLRKLINDLRVEIRNGPRVAMEKGRIERNEARSRILVLKEQFEAFKKEIQREVVAIQKEVIAQNRDILSCLGMGSGGCYGDLQPPTLGEGELVYWRELHPPYETQSQVKMQREHHHQRKEMNDVSRGVKSAQVQREIFEKNWTECAKERIEEPCNDVNAVPDMDSTFSPGIGHDLMEELEDEPNESSEAKRVRVEAKCGLNERISKLEEWLNSSRSRSMRISIPTEVVFKGLIARVIVGPDWFKEMLSPKTNIHGQHLDCYMELLKRRMLGYPENFKLGSVLLGTSFSYAMARACLPHPGLYAHVWKPGTTAYTLWKIESDHSVVVVISVEEWTIYVYDSFDGYENMDALNKQLTAWAQYMRVAMESSPTVEDLPEMVDPSKPAFKINFVDHYKLPRMKGSVDCGVYAIKFIEELATGGK